VVADSGILRNDPKVVYTFALCVPMDFSGVSVQVSVLAFFAPDT